LWTSYPTPETKSSHLLICVTPSGRSRCRLNTENTLHLQHLTDASMHPRSCHKGTLPHRLFAPLVSLLHSDRFHLRTRSRPSWARDSGCIRTMVLSRAPRRRKCMSSCEITYSRAEFQLRFWGDATLPCARMQGSDNKSKEQRPVYSEHTADGIRCIDFEVSYFASAELIS
jgi:hypothetical protein